MLRHKVLFPILAGLIAVVVFTAFGVGLANFATKANLPASLPPATAPTSSWAKLSSAKDLGPNTFELEKVQQSELNPQPIPPGRRPAQAFSGESGTGKTASYKLQTGDTEKPI